MLLFICTNIYVLVVLIVLYLFLPLTALTYYFFRKQRREAEVNRIIKILKMDESYETFNNNNKFGLCLFFAVFYASVISVIGLALLLLGEAVGFTDFPKMIMGKGEFPKTGSRLVLSIAFLGAYLWGLQHVFRRYSLNDLTPSVYYTISIRMVLSAAIAFVIYNASADLSKSNDELSNIWPAFAFLIGMFPQRGLVWLMDRLPIFSSKTNSSVREFPLEMIEGLSIKDKLRLEEMGIDNCSDLANADFVPFMINTPYGARELLDWILQAKLCIYFGDAVKDLRLNGIRTIIDLEGLEKEDINRLAAETAATESVLIRAKESLKDDEIELLRKVVKGLGKFTGIEV